MLEDQKSANEAGAEWAGVRGQGKEGDQMKLKMWGGARPRRQGLEDQRTVLRFYSKYNGKPLNDMKQSDRITLVLKKDHCGCCGNWIKQELESEVQVGKGWDGPGRRWCFPGPGSWPWR